MAVTAEVLALNAGTPAQAAEAVKRVIKAIRWEVTLRRMAWGDAEQAVLDDLRSMAEPPDGEPKETPAQALQGLAHALRHEWETASWFDQGLERLPEADRHRLRLERIIAYGILCNKVADVLDEEARLLSDGAA